MSEPDNVILTHNATHGLNIAIQSLVSPGDTVVISGYEHNAVTRPLHAIGGVSIRIVNGRLFDPEQMTEGFRRALDGKVKAVICTHVSNVFGCVMPMDEIAAICREKHVPLIVDAAQSAGILPVNLKKWGAAYVAMPGHKGLYGPQGTGLLLCGEEYVRSLCWREAREACPASRRCRTFCRIVWRLGRRMFTARPVCWKACVLSGSAAWKTLPGRRRT